MVKVTKTEVVGVDGGMLSVRILGEVNGTPFDEVLDSEMDGNYASWASGEGPVEVGGDDWDAIVEAMDSNPEVEAAVTLYNEGE